MYISTIKRFVCATLASIVIIILPSGNVWATNLDEVIHYSEGSGVGVGAILEQDKSEERYIEEAKESAIYGYNNIAIANVENHLNIRLEPNETSKLVGKMSNNSACEVLSIDGGWAHIISGSVEGYVNTSYLYTGIEARVVAEQIAVLLATSTTGGLRVRTEPNTECEILTTIAEGEKLEVVNKQDNWIEVLVDDEVAYVSSEYVNVSKDLGTAITMTELLYGVGVSDVRVDLCEYAKQFIGNPYVWGGTSLTNGADCSGFVGSVFKKYGIKLPRSSGSMAKEGTKVALSEAKAGDLIFYSNGSRVNHVAIYIGGGQVVHASNPRSGIRISNASYRTIHSIKRFIQD